MKSSRKRILAVAVLAFAALAARADLPRWLQDIRQAKRFEGVFTTTVQLPSGPVTARRPLEETRGSLTELIAAAPKDADLRALRARVEEEQLDPAAAATDWTEHARLAADRGAGYLALADFRHRRLQPQEELRALETAAQAPDPPSEQFLPAAQQRAWRTFERLLALTDSQALPTETGKAEYQLWIKRYPRERTVPQNYFNYLLRKKQFPAAEAALADYRKAFPGDSVFPVSAQARLEQDRGSVDKALTVYDQAFAPLWPPELVKSYFALLGTTHNLRSYLDKARTALAADPSDLNAAARIFYYYQQQGNLPAAERVLLEFRAHKDARQSHWSADELWTLGRLLEAVHNYDEAARNDHALYALTPATAANQERALAALANLLFAAPEQPMRFGAGDLSFYKDVATLDPHPGFLNGILSLLLNSTMPQYKYAEQDRTATAYFHRARAAELLALFDSKFPDSPRRPALTARLVDAYAIYGDNDGVIRAGRGFLAVFPKAAQRTGVALRMSEAYARKGQRQEEFAAYDALLKELAERADGVPLGESTAPAAGQAETEPEPAAAPEPENQPLSRAATRAARSPDYARVLDRYISRLVAIRRPLDAVKLLRRELDRNPNDPGLYARLAAFLEQNRLEADIEQVYQRAIKQFSTMAWYDRLGRWYVRRKQASALEQLTRQVADAFAGTELESYFGQVVRSGTMTPALYLEVNRYAHERFPYDLVFVRNLLAAYTSRETADTAAREQLLSNYWFYADDLRMAYFETLAASGRLNSPGAPQSLPAVRFAAEVEAWRCHFEAAAPGLETVAAQFPADPLIARRAASLDRSLAAFDPKYTDRAAAIAENLHRFNLRDRAALTQIGEIYADREEFARARPLWDQIPRIDPGKPDGYLEAATIFWDYFQFDDALRLIAQARKQSGGAALYAYEAGAIYESKREYPQAIAEYLSGAVPASSARARLLTLAKRPAYQAEIDKLTAERVAVPQPDPAAVSLRIAVLDTLNRRAEVGRLLSDLAARATSVDSLAALRSEAESRGDDSASERILEREAAITSDPVDRMRARLALMRFYEGKNDTARARQAVEALYKDNPAILGVVRATVDFYWRNKLSREAVDTLAASAAASNAGFRKQFTLEAARKAGESGDYARARQFAEALLKDGPFNAEYVSVLADVYAREGDDRGLRAFYEDRIDALRKAPLPADERTSGIAALRRNLIPVLTRRKDYAAGTDQYIEILKSYPEDESLARDAALYAVAHGTRDRLLAYFSKAVADSPRDFRWPMVLARLDTAFEDLPAAIDAYAHAAAVRPDRVDLQTAQAGLEERLMRFEDALEIYTKLYDLTYHNPHWMEKAAEVHARLGRKDAAVKALRVAFLDGRPDRPQPFFDVARILDGWNLVAEARPFAERGVALAGSDLLGEYNAGAAVYTTIMTRLRAHEIAFERLRTVAGTEPERLDQPLRTMGDAVKRYFTPEEKSALEAFLDKQKAVVPVEPLLALVERAGMTALEARRRFDLLMSNPSDQAPLGRLIELQGQRLKYDELGVQLEAYWQVFTNQDTRDQLLDRAAEAYQHAGNAGAELRVLTLHQQHAGLSGPLLDRYFELLAALAPDRLILAAERAAPFDNRDRAANAALAAGKPKLGFDAIRARGRSLPAVWTRAYTGLAGVYFADTSPAVEADFAAAIGDAPIGQRLGRPVNRDERLAGGVWFYYGTVLGEFLTLAKKGDPEDYLPALLEGTPARASAYVTLADYYADTRAPDRALADYAHALELDANRADVHDRMAVILWDQGHQDEAVAHWKAAFAAFRRLEDARLAESFWTDLPAALEHIGARGLLAPVRQEADAVLRTYIRRNGAYRVAPLVDAALSAVAGSSEGAAWIVDLSRAAASPRDFLEAAAESKRLSNPQRNALYQHTLALETAAAAEPGPAHEWAVQRLHEWQFRRIGFLLDTDQAARAQAELAALPESARVGASALEIRAAAQLHTLPQLLERYSRDPEHTPPLDVLRQSADQLKTSGDADDARRLLEFVYTHELDSQNLTAANFLGLAEIRLEQGDVKAALALLRRMTLVAGEPFENLTPAASLLEKAGRKTEAHEFLAARVKAVPWDLESRAQFGDAAVARLSEAAYQTRIEAARLAPASKLGSEELDLLAGGAHPAPAAAEKPYFYAARLAAADAASDPQARLNLLRSALAVNPETPPRILLFHAALAAGNPRLAVSALEPLLENLRYLSEQPDAERESSIAFAAGQFLAGQFNTSERAALARESAAAWAKLDEPGRAAFFYRIALELAPTPEAQAALAAIRAEQKLRAANAARRPVISAGLEQERLVQPRLEGGTSR